MLQSKVKDIVINFIFNLKHNLNLGFLLLWQQYLTELNGNTPVKSKELPPEQQCIQELEVQLKRAQRDNDILKIRCLLHPRQSKLKIVKQMKILLLSLRFNIKGLIGIEK